MSDANRGRDLELHELMRRAHLAWGNRLYATDIDYLVLEYTKEDGNGDVDLAALVEYKRWSSTVRYPYRDAGYKAILKLASRHPHLPVMMVRYQIGRRFDGRASPMATGFHVWALNYDAKRFFSRKHAWLPNPSPDEGEHTWLSERAFVEMQYELRGLKAKPEDLAGLSTEEPRHEMPEILGWVRPTATR